MGEEDRTLGVAMECCIRSCNPHTYEVMAKYYALIEKYGCTFIMMYHTKKDSSVKSVSEKVIGSQALSGSVDTIIAINKASEL